MRLGRLPTVILPSVCAIIAFTALGLPALASGGEGLAFEQKLEAYEIQSSRARLVARLNTGGVQVKWYGEYREASQGAWISAGGATSEREPWGGFPPSVSTILEEEWPVGSHVFLGLVHHLKPTTKYVARFRAEDVNKGVAVTELPFETQPPAAPEVTDFEANAVNPTEATASAEIESNGLQTTYELEYELAGSEAWKIPPSGGGTITVEEDFAEPNVRVTGLSPETRYCTRARANNERGEVTRIETLRYGNSNCFTTPTAKPQIPAPTVRNITGTSARLSDAFVSHGSETHWRFEYAPPEEGREPMANSPAWLPVSDGEGVVSQAQAEAHPEGAGLVAEATFAGLEPQHRYYVRLFAENAAGEGVVCASESCESILVDTRKVDIVGFSTFGAPLVNTLAIHGVHDGQMRALGGVNPDSVPTSGEQELRLGSPTGGSFTLSFKGKQTTAVPYNAKAEEVAGALDALEVEAQDGKVTKPAIAAFGPDGGPYVLYFYGIDGGVEEPAISGDGSNLVPAGGVSVTVIQSGGEAYDTRYWVEYDSQTQYEEAGFKNAISTPKRDLGSGELVDYVGEDLQSVTPGETYHFRIAATNTSPKDPVVYGEDRVLTVPAVQRPNGGLAACPNENVRTGLSAHLPDCRAYEQLTPSDKGGAQEIFNYGGTFGQEGAVPAQDGESMEYSSVPVKWGKEAQDGQSPYFFTRGEGGWNVVAGGAQPEAGVAHYSPRLLARNLEDVAFNASWNTSPQYKSEIEFKVGPRGGPYTTVASTKEEKSRPGWIAAAEEFSKKLVLEVTDHNLLGHPTGTLEGFDLYEYSMGQLRQVNVTGTSPGVQIGSCGARIADGARQKGTAVAKDHAVSRDGAIVFFEETPGKDCSQQMHVYARVDGGSEDAHTADLGAYRMIAADPNGDRVLLERETGAGAGLYLYDIKTEKAEFLPGSEIVAGLLPGSSFSVQAEYSVSDDLSTVYISRKARAGTLSDDLDVYRYDVAHRSVVFMMHMLAKGNKFYEASPDGRYLYFIAASVGGLPAGGTKIGTAGTPGEEPASQVFRLDSQEMAVECLSCASGFDPEPHTGAVFTKESLRPASVNGQYVFFDSTAQLVEGDVDGEIEPEGLAFTTGGKHTSAFYSLSSDVYEWRAPGVDGCGAVQGCVSLITSGKGGFLNILLGTSASGRDVFFATNESLLPSDKDTAGDIYDARVGGGFGEPVPPPPCEGDSCSTPFAPPSEVTPASATFEGAGNIKHEAKTERKAAIKHRCRSKHRCTRHAHKRRRSKGHRLKTGIRGVPLRGGASR